MAQAKNPMTGATGEQPSWFDTLTPEQIRMFAMFANTLGQGIAGKGNALESTAAMTQQWGSIQAMGEMLNKALTGGGKLTMDGTHTTFKVPHVLDQTNAGSAVQGPDQKAANTGAMESVTQPGVSGGLNPYRPRYADEWHGRQQ